MCASSHVVGLFHVFSRVMHVILCCLWSVLSDCSPQGSAHSNTKVKLRVSTRLACECQGGFSPSSQRKFPLFLPGRSLLIHWISRSQLKPHFLMIVFPYPSLPTRTYFPPKQINRSGPPVTQSLLNCVMSYPIPVLPAHL